MSCRWGAEAAHATLSSQPHLLASAMASLDTNSEGLQKLLGCTQQQLQRFVRKVPRCVVPLSFWRHNSMGLGDLSDSSRPVLLTMMYLGC